MSVPHLCPAWGAATGRTWDVDAPHSRARAGSCYSGLGLGFRVRVRSGNQEFRARGAHSPCARSILFLPELAIAIPCTPGRQTRPSATRPPTHGVGVAWHGVAREWRGARVAWARNRQQRISACRHRVHVLPCAWRVHELACAWRVGGAGSAIGACGLDPAWVGVDVFGPPIREEGRLIQALLRVGFGLGVGLGDRVEGATQGKGHLVTRIQRWATRPSLGGARAGRRARAGHLGGARKPCVWAEGERSRLELRGARARAPPSSMR